MVMKLQRARRDWGMSLTSESTGISTQCVGSMLATGATPPRVRGLCSGSQSLKAVANPQPPSEPCQEPELVNYYPRHITW